MNEINEDRLRRFAPSVFAEHPHDSVSDRYAMIPTIDVLRGLNSEGWMPVHAREGNARAEHRVGYMKHLVRLRHRDDLNRPAVVGGIVPEIVLVNSHDGTCAYQLHVGLHRYICANGMVVSDSLIHKLAIRHSGNVVDDVIEGTYEIVKDVPKIVDRIGQYSSIDLSGQESRAMATAALALRWPDRQAPIDESQLTEPKRYDDRGRDLWTRFNVMQEHLLRGGLLGRAPSGRRTRTRAIQAVTEDIRLNKALWVLADEMARIKTGDPGALTQ